MEPRPKFGQRRVGLLGDQRLQPLPAAGGQPRLATTLVSLRCQRPAGFKVLAHPPHRRHAVTEAGGNVAGAFALSVKLKNALSHWNRYGLHAKTLPCYQPL